MKLLDRSKPFYKANFHTHTTNSDGQLSPEECMRLYRGDGYDILALTDHRKVTVPEHIPEGLLMIPGTELDFLLPGQAVHLLGLGVTPHIAEVWDRNGTPQQAIDAILACEGLAVLAHPAWSLNDTETMASLHGLSAVEIWNSVSMPPYNAMRGDSSSVLDALWSNHPDTLLPVMANDDTHFYGIEFGAGWNMVQADALTVPAVLTALREGRYYATQGPRLLELELTENTLRVCCSPADTIIFYSNRPWVAGRVTTGNSLTEAVYPIGRGDRYVRVQVIDANGKSAWSRPIACL